MRILLTWLLAVAVCPAAEQGAAPVAERIARREFPSVFQAWNGAAPVAGVDKVDMEARHDLIFLHPTAAGLRSEAVHEGTAFSFTPASIAAAQAKRAALLARNANVVLLAEIRYRDAPKGFIAEESPWWKRDEQKRYVMGWEEGGYRLLDVAHPEWQAQVAKRAQAVLATGVFDGIMLDWWTDDADRLSLITKIRAVVGETALVLVNSNDHPIPRTASQVNGLYMECYRTAKPEDWKRITETLRWAGANLRTPRINCVESWYHQSRQDLPLMRAVTTLSLVHSDGYCLFADPNELPTPDHLHDWYDFWDKGLGRPVRAGVQRADGAWEREYSGGTAVHNPAGGAAVTVQFDTARRSRATGRTGTTHSIAAGDGDIFVRPGAKPD